MKPHPHFITFEGIDGSGKSTQIKLLADFLSSKSHQVLVTHEPGATQLGKHIRELVLHTDQAIDPLAELLLFASDRAQHVKEIIAPALAKNHWVLCDRYIDSTTAYQGYGRELDLDVILKINSIASNNLLPSKTFFLNGPVEILLSRAEKRGQKKFDRLEADGLGFFKKIQQGYQQLALESPERFIELDALASMESIFEKIVTVLKA